MQTDDRHSHSTREMPQDRVDCLQGAPLHLSYFFQLALAMTRELAHLHLTHGIHGYLTPDEFAVHGSSVKLRHDDERARLPVVITKNNLPYLSPEQLGGWGKVPDNRSDLYALGVIFYQMLTGSLPFPASDELELFHGHLAKTPMFSHGTGLYVPARLQTIILKLLAKDMKDRYQSAHGLLNDLGRCQNILNANLDHEEFPLGMQDISIRLQISQKIYGRQREQAELLAAVDRVRHGGLAELVLISGMAGVGKTTLIRDLYEPVTMQGGFFLAGKFEQLNTEIPYLTLAQAFQSLITQVLGENETRLASWRQKLNDALGQQGHLITQMIPSTAIIIGHQPPVPELPPLESQHRFHTVFKKFLSVFATAQHPLVLFLDDLQWADAANLKILENLATDTELHHVLMLGARRSQHEQESRPLDDWLNAIRKAQGRVHESELAPLQPDHLQSFLADILLTHEPDVTALAALLHQKTDGNPFFFIQYMKSLAEENLLTLDVRSGAWTWNVDAIQAKNYADNVIDFMLTRLRKMPRATQRVLQYAACLGSRGRLQDLESFARNQGHSWESVQPDLFPGILLQTGPQFRFLHDRLQQAAYALLRPDEQKEVHLSIARRVDQTSHDDDRSMFNMMSHYQLARDLLIDRRECLHVAQRSLAAALKAKALAANPSALEYSRLGLTLLPDDAWEVDYDLTLGLHRAHAESLWRCGKADEAGRCLTELLNVAQIAPLDRLGLYHTLIEIDTTQGLTQKALHTCQEGLASVGVDFTMDPTDDQVLEVYRAYRSSLQNRAIESLLELPPLTDPLEKAAMDCMAAAIPAAILTSLNMGTYLCCKMVHSSLMHGTSHATAAAYSYFAMLLGPVFGEYEEAYRLGKVAYELSQRETHFWKARIYVTFGNAVNFWTQPMRTDLPYVYAARPVAQEVGDVAGACFCCNHLISTLLALGAPLPDVDAEITRALEFLQAMNYPAIADILLGQQRLVRRLRADGEFNADDIGYTTRVLSSPMILLRCWYHTWNLQACYLLEKPDEALRAAEAAQPFLWSSRGHLEEVEYAFYHALTLAQVCTQASGAQRKVWLNELLAYGETWQEWAHNSPENFSARYHLIQAETARLMKEDLKAMHHYDEAIRLARQNSFIQVEALSYELASHFCERSGFQAFCDLYLQEARRCYEAWGATGKLRLLKDHCPHSSPVTGHGMQDSVHQSINIDRLSLLRATQSISSEIIPNQLIEKLMRLLVEASGAERGYLITSSEDTYHVRAGAETRAGQLQVEMFTACPGETFPHLPQTILNYVRRSRDKVLIADARAPHAFTSDEFLQHHPVKSILCLPILKHQVLIGMIYLENKFVAGAFTPSKLTALEIIASQAAISMENARLYDELKGQEEKLRATLESIQPGGRHRIVRVSASPMRQPSGEIPGAVLVLRDVTELTELDRLKDEFLRAIAHELKTPLLVVTGYFELFKILTQKGADAQKLQETMLRMDKGLSQLKSLMTTMVDTAAFQLGKLKLHRESFELRPFIQELIQARTFQDDRHRLKFAASAHEPGMIRADRMRLTQVMTNLLQNALKYAREGDIELNIVDDDDFTVISIKDQGIGIPLDRQDRIFQRFYRAHAETEHDMGGMGVGLFLAQEIIQAHQGTIWFSSQPGAGSIFSFRLPNKQK